MRLLIFGASGGVGRHVRILAREQGHELALFSRDPAALEPLASNERTIRGDIADARAVAAAVEGVDAVISTVGPTSNSADQVTLFESFARTLVGAMQDQGVRRLVAISGAGCTLPGERKPLRGRVASALVKLAVRHVVAAKQRELEIIAASDVEWIAPRPARVRESSASGSYRVGPDAGLTISAGDLAQFMLAQLTDDRYLRQAPIVSN